MQVIPVRALTETIIPEITEVDELQTLVGKKAVRNPNSLRIDAR